MADEPARKPWQSERHERQRAKNWIVLGAIVAVFALFFVITIIKIGGAGVLPGAPR
ncbi:MAG: hypothetical protein IPK81_07855 [Rhodospirillales bacterium]|nr:hypothetical protein [Rhodospirillales bacterium]QQS14086.1 MAG: hypothetical protein IPK81_07855 [Rhodospirillales bacterium]